MQVETRNVRKLDEPIHQACQVKKNAGKCNDLRKQQKTAEDKLNETRE